MRDVRGNEISMIFQEPMTSLNPVMTIGKQIAETVRLHQDSEIRRATIGRFRIALSDAEYSWPSFEKHPKKADDSSNTGLPESIVKAIEAKERTDDQKKALLAHFEWALLSNDSIHALNLAPLRTCSNGQITVHCPTQRL